MSNTVYAPDFYQITDSRFVNVGDLYKLIGTSYALNIGRYSHEISEFEELNVVWDSEDSYYSREGKTLSLACKETDCGLSAKYVLFHELGHFMHRRSPFANMFYNLPSLLLNINRVLTSDIFAFIGLCGMVNFITYGNIFLLPFLFYFLYMNIVILVNEYYADKYANETINSLYHRYYVINGSLPSDKLDYDYSYIAKRIAFKNQMIYVIDIIKFIALILMACSQIWFLFK